MIAYVSNRRFTSVVALWLLLLAALPVTAPFATCDLVPLGLAPVLDSVKTKASNDDVIATPTLAVTILSLDCPSALLTRRASSLHARRAQRPVLRL